MDTSRWYKLLLIGVILIGLLGAGSAQNALNRDRVALGVSRGEALGSTAPPVLVFTTVALGGLRGLIANALWVRAMELQEADKYFEKVQLADWITKLQPHFVNVWLVQAWDMAYNISVKFTDPADRWKWVSRGLELLRDEALQYNPDEPLIYRELAWFFQHKIGQDLDDAHMYYKAAWGKQMDEVLGKDGYPALLDPKTDDQRRRSEILRTKYKLDPAHMKEVDDQYGPLEWRLPESHAIYWATLGLQKTKAGVKDLMPLRRVVYQAMQEAFRRGRLIELGTPEGRRFQFGPNLGIVGKTSEAYERMMEQEPESKTHIQTGHRNFLKDAVYYLYTHNQPAEADRWMKYLLNLYPDAMVVDVRKTNAPALKMAGMSVEDYAIARVTEVAGETSNVRVSAAIEGLLLNSFYNLGLGEADLALGYDLLARKIWERYQSKTIDQQQRIGLVPYPEMKQEALRIFETNSHPLLVARVRTELGLPPLTNAPPAGTNAPAGTPPVSPAEGGTPAVAPR